MDSSPSRSPTLEWDFGDGFSSIQYGLYHRDTTHTYANAGTYTITLRISYIDNNGQLKTGQVSQTLTLGSALPASYCTPEDDTLYEYIDSLTINGVTYRNGDEGGLLNPNAPIILHANRRYDFNLHAGIPAGEMPYEENYHIWLDINGDGVFGDGDWRNDKTERMAALFDAAATGSVSGSFTSPTVPSPMANHSMRILQLHAVLPVDNINPCQLPR